MPKRICRKMVREKPGGPSKTTTSSSTATTETVKQFLYLFIQLRSQWSLDNYQLVAATKNVHNLSLPWSFFLWAEQPAPSSSQPWPSSRPESSGHIPSEELWKQVYRLDKGSSCGTVGERIPHDREVVGLNPAGCWAFFFFSLTEVCP